MINVSEWQPSQQLTEVFLSLPRQIYRHDPLWPGEDQASLKQQFSQENVWFEQGKAWTGTIPGKARLAGFLPPIWLKDRGWHFLVSGKALTTCPAINTCSTPWPCG